jgi:glycosyltransferase involved in cell wall biosynthesis
MKTVLLVAYYYPPLGGIGSQRSQKFARYLGEYGWRPIVLAPEKGSYYLDPSLDDLTARGVEVIRTRTFDLSSIFKKVIHRKAWDIDGAAGQSQPQLTAENRVLKIMRWIVNTWVYIPDGQIGWFPYAVRAGRRAIEEHQIDAIYSTSFPVTSHLIAYKLKCATNKPWVADFRDLWTEHHYADHSAGLRRRIDRMIESRILEKADSILTVSDGFADSLRRLAPSKRIEVIRNGFDSEEFAKIQRRAPSKWTITYVGSFYGGKQDPSPFLEALARMMEDKKIPREDVCFQVLGEPEPVIKDLLALFGLTDVTTFTGVVPHSASLSYQVNSSVLLFILDSRHANPGVIPGKVYEYLGSGRPILGIVPPNFEIARIVRETGAGVTVNPPDLAGIEQSLVDFYLEFRAGACGGSNASDVSEYERRAGARQLADLLVELTEPGEIPQRRLAEVI